MTLLLVILLVGLLSAVVIQDFRSREMSWVLIPLLFIGFTVYGLLQIRFTEFAAYFGANILIVTINLLGVTLMVSLKERKLVNIIDTYLGLGDVLFFVVLAVAFSPINFLIFYLGSILLITLIYGGVLLINKKKNALIPLAGAMSLLLVVFMLIEQLTSFQFYQDIPGLVPGSFNWE